MKIKVRHILIAFSSIIILIRYEELLRIFNLLFLWTGSFFSGNFQEMTLELFDYVFSALVLVVLLIYSLISRDKFIRLKLIPSAAILLVMFLAALTAPVFSSFSPDFQKNLSVTKHLPPFSKKILITPAKDIPEDYSTLRKKIVQENLYKDAEVADSISFTKTSFYRGKNQNSLNGYIKSYNVRPVIYLLGTDELGRDLFSRLVYGTRISLTVGLLSVTISLFIGLLLGFFAGYYEGWSGAVLNRITDIFLSFPSLFLIILVLAFFGNSIVSVIVVLGFTGWMSLFKIIRGEVKSLRSRDFFITASSLGLNKRTLLFKEMLPIVIVPVINNLILLFGSVIVAEASLSYIGLGTGMMYPSWGSMIDQGQNYMRSAWWMILMPGLFLFTTLFSANNMGKIIQSYFNPRLK